MHQPFPKISLTKRAQQSLPRTYCRIVLTEDSRSTHRLIERPDSTLEYRMGVGKWKQVTPRTFITTVRAIVQAARAHKLERIAIGYQADCFPQLAPQGKDWFSRTFAENLTLAAYEFTTYKSKPDTKLPLVEILVCGDTSKSEQAAFATGLIVGQAANLTRSIANTSASEMTPTELGKQATSALKGTSATVQVLGESALRKLNMNLLLAVGGGTSIETKLIIIEYWGAGKPRLKQKVTKALQPLVFIGKGITYDTGGLNVKPSGAMHDMHLDMSGGAAVIGALQAIAQQKLKRNVIGIIPAAENAVSDRSMRAGDIITAMNGTTVEVIHTDAEGRMVLADALTYSERYRPYAILDIATLTGAALVALGQQASALMTPHETLRHKLQELSEASGDYTWPLPLWNEYDQNLKSSRADIANIAPNFSRFGGAIEGGIFLKHFAPKRTPWAHLDIAPRMASIPSDKLAKGATGEPVRLLVRIAETLKGL